MKQDAKKVLKIILISIFFLIIIFYAFLTSKDLIFGVKIKNVNIIDNSKVNTEILPITGTARHAIKLRLNQREISVDQQGNFSESIALSPGYNIINIIAQDKFGNVDEKNYKLILTKELLN